MPFTASIIERTFTYIPDKILKLGACSWLRKIDATQPWQRLRIGLLCAVPYNADANIVDVNFLLGVCSGKSYPGSSFNTLNFVGASIIGTQAVGTSRTLTWNSSSYYSATAGYFFCKQDGAIISSTAGFSPTAVFPPAFTGRFQRRAPFILDIWKTAGDNGTYTLTLYGVSTTVVQTFDARPDDLLEAVDTTGIPTLRGQTLSALLSTTLIASTVLGEFDTVEVYWSSNRYPLEISAIAASVQNPTLYSAVGGAIDTFASYAVSSGSIPEATFLTGGSGWSADGSLSYTRGSGGLLLGSSNLAPQIVTQYVGTTNTPDDPFEQYATGTVNSGTAATISLGSYWAANGQVIAAQTALLPAVYTELVGTNYMPYDLFDTYTVNNGSTTGSTTSSFNANGSLWAATGTVYSVGSWVYSGSTTGDSFPAVYAVYNTPSVGNALYGTAVGLPFDTFEQYGTGAVVSGVTINAGTGFSGAGSVYSYII